MRSSSLSVLLLAALLVATQLAPIKSGVWHWRDLKTEQRGGHTERSILAGSTRDLARLELRFVTLEPRRAQDSTVIDIRDSEVLLIVKDGHLDITMNGKKKMIGSGSIALALPGDPIVVANAAATPATYYLFVYQSKAPPDVARGYIAGGSFVVDWNDYKVSKSATGLRRDVFDRPTAMFARFEMHVSTLNEGLTNHAVHTHRAEELVLMREGSAEMVIADPGHRLSAGDVAFLESNVTHSLKNTGKNPTEYFAFQGL